MIKRLAISSFLIFSNMTLSYASEDVAHRDVGGHGEEVSGLPQLDPSSFESQTFWLVVVFISLYFFFSKKSLPEISKTIEHRAERIKNDLDSAESLKEEVASVQETYEASLKEARAESSGAFKRTEEEIKEKADAQTKSFKEHSAEKITELETSINNARDAAMDDMADIAAEVALQAAEKIIGVRTDAKSARDVVKSISKAA